MVKPDYNRDYYADLELPSTVDVAEVKKQFRKLALRYHPDRNVGKEEEAKEKFLVIQAAHEILTDSTLKAKYDANRKRSPFPGASGIRGNPFQNVSQDVADRFGAPPKRKPQAPTRPAPTPYSSWGVPPQPKAKQGDAFDHLRAWDRMRSSSSRSTHTASTANTSQKASRPQTTKADPPPPPPRTAFQARQQEASFGTRKTGVPPVSPIPDEPPAKNQHYANYHSNIYDETAANLRKPRPASVHVDPLSEQFGETFRDNRQRTPYASHVGEKLNPFEGATASRAKSVRESWRRFQESDDDGSPLRPRRQRSASVGESESPNRTQENTPLNGFSPTPNPRFQSSASARYSPRPVDPTSAPPTATDFSSAAKNTTKPNGKGNGSGGAPKNSGPNVFTVPDDDDDDTFQPSPAVQQARFMRNSTDNINTRFVAEERAGEKYEFSAGAASTTDDPFLRAKQRSRSAPRGRQSPLKAGFQPTEPLGGAPHQGDSTQKPSGFDAGQWTEKIGPHNFVPPPITRQSTSPTRHGRTIKKPKPVRMTAGTAGMVEDEETSGEDRPRPPPAISNINGAPSPNAMDIDTPPPEPAAPKASGARSVHVEPSKPEWRAGNVDGAKPEPTLGSGLKVPRPTVNAAGSEDTEEFTRPVFPEFQQQEPFAPKPSGLSGWSDIKLNLPFDSKPSTKLPFEVEKPKGPPVAFPQPPLCPKVPPALAIKDLKPSTSSWIEYVRNFDIYLRSWAEWEKRITDHFDARKRVGEAQGKTRFAWVNTRGDQGIQQYIRELEQDKFIRQKWMAACDAHELRVREFAKHRDKMKQHLEVS